MIMSRAQLTKYNNLLHNLCGAFLSYFFIFVVLINFSNLPMTMCTVVKMYKTLQLQTIRLISIYLVNDSVLNVLHNFLLM